MTDCWELSPKQLKARLRINPYYIPNHRQIGLLLDSGWSWNLIYLYRRGLVDWTQFVWSLALSEDPQVIQQLDRIDWTRLDQLNPQSSLEQLKSLHTLISAILSTTTDTKLASFLIHHPKLPLLVERVGRPLTPILKWEGSILALESPFSSSLLQPINWNLLESPLIKDLVKIPATQLNSETSKQLNYLAHQDSLRFNQLLSQALGSITLERRQILEPSSLVRDHFNLLFYERPGKYSLTPLLQHLVYLKQVKSLEARHLINLTLEIYDHLFDDQKQLMGTLLLELIQRGVNSRTFAMAYFLNLIKSLGLDLTQEWFDILTRSIPANPFNHRWLQFYFKLKFEFDEFDELADEELLRQSLIECLMATEDLRVLYLYRDIPLQYCLKILASTQSVNFAETIWTRTFINPDIEIIGAPQYPVKTDFYSDPCQLKPYTSHLEGEIFSLLKKSRDQSLIQRFQERIIRDNNFKPEELNLDLSWLPIIIKEDSPNFLSKLKAQLTDQFFKVEGSWDSGIPQVSFYQEKLNREKLQVASQELSHLIYELDPYVADQIPLMATDLTLEELLLFYRTINLFLPFRPEYEGYDRNRLALTLINHLIARYSENPSENWSMMMTISQLMDFISFRKDFDWSQVVPLEVPETSRNREQFVYRKWKEHYRTTHPNQDISVEFRSERFGISLRNNEMLIRAIQEGDVIFVRTAPDRYGLGPEDVRARNNQALILAAQKGQAEILRLFHDLYGLGPEDARSQNNQALRMAILSSRTEVLRVFHDLYGLGPEDLMSSNIYGVVRILDLARYINNPQVIEVIENVYGIRV